MTAPGAARNALTIAGWGAAPETADVEALGVRKTYGDVVAVDDVDLVVGRGEFFTLLGPSGSGKTTTLRLIAGFEHPDAGRIRLAGADVTALAPYARQVSTVFQDYALFPHMTVGENVEYGLKVKKVPRADRRGRVQEVLRMVRLEGFERRKPVQLSGGQRQRVALARSIVTRPQVLLLDEPLGALDLKLRQEMQLFLKGLQHDLGITFVYVTHDQEEALTMSDRLAVFNAGRIEQVGAPADVYERPRTEFVAGFVGVSNVLEDEGRRFTVRPEKITMSHEGPGRPGTIADVIYVGSFTRYVVELDTGDTLTVVRQNDRPVEEQGTRVFLDWSPEYAYVIDPPKEEE
jgi:putative spermidine/putrescine transport system ATP-binding protein